MLKVRQILLFTALAALLLAGCSQDRGPIAPTNDAPPADLGYVLPEGATLTSATFKVFAVGATFENVGIYRTTVDWEETTVTWDNFDLYGGSFDPAALGGFTVSTGMAYYAVDATGQVITWMNDQPQLRLPDQAARSTTPAHGVAPARRGQKVRPLLDLTYTLGGDALRRTPPRAPGRCGDFLRRAVFPDQNFGASDKLLRLAQRRQQVALVRVDQCTGSELTTIGDYIWYRSTRSGIQDDGEIGVEGVPSTSPTATATSWTPAHGMGTVRIVSRLPPAQQLGDGFVLPDGYIFGPQISSPTTFTLDSDADPNTRATVSTATWTPSRGASPGSRTSACRTAVWLARTPSATGSTTAGLGNGSQDDMVARHCWGDSTGSVTRGRAKSLGVTDRCDRLVVLTQHVYGAPSNGITKLYARSWARS